MGENASFEERELLFYKQIVADYLKYGSVDAVFRKHNWDLPVSYSGFHHLLNRWGIVKAAGPNTKFSGVIAFLMRLIEEQIPLERLYKKMPLTFKEMTSVQTLHRVLNLINSGISRRVGTALVIRPDELADQVLIGNDISTPRLELGKTYGSISLPMGFAKRGEERERSILRVLQREVFSDLAVARNFPYEVIPVNPEPFMKILIADVRVSVYSITIPTELMKHLSSGILTNLHFEASTRISEADSAGNNFRAGVVDICQSYQKLLDRELGEDEITISQLNYALASTGSSAGWRSGV